MRPVVFDANVFMAAAEATDVFLKGSRKVPAVGEHLSRSAYFAIPLRQGIEGQAATKARNDRGGRGRSSGMNCLRLSPFHSGSALPVFRSARSSCSFS